MKIYVVMAYDKNVGYFCHKAFSEFEKAQECVNENKNKPTFYDGNSYDWYQILSDIYEVELV